MTKKVHHAFPLIIATLGWMGSQTPFTAIRSHFVEIAIAEPEAADNVATSIQIVAEQ